MWAPVEVWEWIEDLPRPHDQYHRVWYMQVQPLTSPAAPSHRTACGFYLWGGNRPAALL